MARLHSRKKGKSGSKKPASSNLTKVLKIKKEEVEELIEKLAKEGRKPEEMGQILRDQHGIPSVKEITGKTMQQVLKEKKLEPKYPSDLLNLITRAVKMRKHLKDNRTDTSNKVKLVHVESKIKRLVRYYRGNKLPKDWVYNPEEAALIVK
ncbi:MAG: 30S ribosomal protein S15 [Candidatus Micrarchaeota archaeon]